MFYAYLLLIFWAPLPFASNRPWAWSLLALWIFLLGVWWCVLFIKGRVSLPVSFKKSRLVIVLFLLWLAYLVYQAGFVSVDPYATRVGLLKSVAYVVVFLLTLLLVDNHKRMRQLAYTLVFSGLFQAVYGGLMALSGLGYGFFVKYPNAMAGMASGTFVNKNHLAGYLEMTLAVGIGLLIGSLGGGFGDSWKKRLLSLSQLLLSEKARLRIFLVIMVIALVLTRSRMGNTAFFSSLLIAGGIGLLCSRYATRSMVVLLISLVVIDIVIVGSWFGIEKVKQRLEQTSLATESRDEIYADAITVWSDHKWTGTGLGSFYAVYPQYRGNDVNGFIKFIENDYLQFLAETGVTGTALLGLIVLSSFCLALFAHYKRRDPLLRGMSFAAIMGIVSIMIHSAADFNLQMPANAVTFVILLAIAWISAGLENHRKQQPIN